MLRTRQQMGVCEPLMRNVVAQRTYLQIHYANMVGSYTENPEKQQTVKIGGWALAWVWALSQDNTSCE